MRQRMDVSHEGDEGSGSPPPSSPRRRVGTSTPPMNHSHPCHCFKGAKYSPCDPDGRVLASMRFPCDVCIDGLLEELDSIMSKLSSLQSTVDGDKFRLSLEVATPALRLLSAHLGEGLDSSNVSEASEYCGSNLRETVDEKEQSTPKFTSLATTITSVSTSRVPARARTPLSPGTLVSSVISEKPLGTFRPSQLSMSDLSCVDVGTRESNDGHSADYFFLARPNLVSFENCYLDPSGRFKMAWDTIALLLILALVFVVPFEMTFLWDVDTNATDSYPTLWWFAIVVDYFFGVDLILNFFTAYYSKEGKAELVKRHSKILKRYLHGWFWIDIISTFPFSRIVELFGKSSSGFTFLRVLRITKISRMLRVIRGMKLGGLSQMWETRFIATRASTVAFHLFKLCLCMLISCHWAGCFWFTVGYFSGQLGYTRTWLQHFSDASVTDLWSASFYFCITTGSTVGYGDIHATNTMEMLAGSFLLTCSVLGIGQMIAQVGEAFSMFQEQNAQTLRLKREAKAFMRKREVPRQLYLQVLRFLDGIVKNDSLTSLDGVAFVEYLSESLQSELRFAIVGGVIKSFPVFSSIHDQFIKALCQVVETQRAGVGDIVVETEQSCEAMFMIVKGELSYLPRRGRGGTLSRLDWFGERALFLDGIVYNMIVTCELDSELLVLRRTGLIEQLAHFPKVRAEYQSILETLQARLKPKARVSIRRASKQSKTSLQDELLDNDAENKPFGV